MFDLTAMSKGDAQRQFATLPKIKVDNPVVDLDGDEMTRCAADAVQTAPTLPKI